MITIPGMRIVSEESRKQADEAFPELLDDPDLLIDRDNIKKLMADGEGKLAEVEAEFDARRPAQINLRLVSMWRKTHGDQLHMLIGIGDGSLPQRGRSVHLSYHPDRRPLKEALTLMRKHAADIIEKLHDARICNSFLRRYGRAFREENFDKIKGVTIHDRIPR